MENKQLILKPNNIAAHCILKGEYPNICIILNNIPATPLQACLCPWCGSAILKENRSDRVLNAAMKSHLSHWCNRYWICWQGYRNPTCSIHSKARLGTGSWRQYYHDRTHSLHKYTRGNMWAKKRA